MKFYRRGITKEIEFTRGEAPKLFGLLARAVASAGGEPEAAGLNIVIIRDSGKA